MIDDEHFHLESLEEFTSELASAGFLRIPGNGNPIWRGKIHPAFGSLTDAETMDIVIAPGWPFQPPAVFVQGLNTNHSTLDGLVCMWQEGDFSHDWTTVQGLFSRIEQWCERARNGWENDQLELDALLNFRAKSSVVATFDLDALGVSEGGWGEFCGVVSANPPKVEIGIGHRASSNSLRGMWFHVGELQSPPPRQMSEVLQCLSRHQRRGLQRALDERRRADAFVPCGGVDLVLFCWTRNRLPDLLVMGCTGTSEEVEAFALQPGPNDEGNLMLRAGPDASDLSDCRTIMFGAGALGGHAALLLAQSGLRHLAIVDPDVLLPGNVVRHVAGHGHVGAPKVQAVQAVIRDHAPWAKVVGFQESPRSPSEIRRRIGDASIVIDTTGNEAFTNSLAMMTGEMGISLVSGALYRGGFIGRIQRQALPNDTPIHQRGDLNRYPAIPPGDRSQEFATPQLGCSAPVNNAPPSAVTACASLVAQTALDVLIGRFECPDETLEVYRTIADHPFDRLGRVSHQMD